MIAIGVGDDVDTRELGYIAGKNVILSSSFDEVLTKADRLIDQLTLGACREVYQVGKTITCLLRIVDEPLESAAKDGVTIPKNG